MAQGAFIVSQNVEDEKDILFNINPDVPEPTPENQLKLKSEIEKVLYVIKMLFENNRERFFEYFYPLLSLSQAGLVGDSAQPEVARRALSSLKDEIVDRESGTVKNSYMKKLGIRALILGALSAIVGFLLALTNNALLSSFAFLWTGCMGGVWLSFGARKTFLRFEDLHVLERDRMEPIIRLIFAGLLSTIIGLIISNDIIVIELGSFSSRQLNDNPAVALLIGSLLGFSEKALAVKVRQQASRFLNF